MLTKELEQKLMSTAIEYRKRSYSPYSGFQVGAALLSADGEIFFKTDNDKLFEFSLKSFA